jgi:drug/metabolite transporter (DMT)-like permease
LSAVAEPVAVPPVVRQTPPHVWPLVGLMLFLWSINFVVAKVVLREFPPLLAGALRFTFAGAMIWPAYMLTRRRGAARLDRRSVIGLLGLGLLGVGLNQLFFLIGLVRTSVAHASILMVTIPVIVLLLGALFGHERLSARRIAGMCIAIAGVGALHLGPSASARAASGFGDLFVFLAALVFGLFTVFGKGLRERFDSMTINTFAYAGSAVVLLPVTLWHAWGFPFGSVSAGAWLGLVFMAVFPSLVCYMIFNYALSYIPPSRITSLTYLQPLLATFFAVVLLSEPVTGAVISGGLLVLLGVFLTQR